MKLFSTTPYIIINLLVMVGKVPDIFVGVIGPLFVFTIFLTLVCSVTGNVPEYLFRFEIIFVLTFKYI